MVCSGILLLQTKGNSVGNSFDYPRVSWSSKDIHTIVGKAMQTKTKLIIITSTDLKLFDQKKLILNSLTYLKLTVVDGHEWLLFKNFF